MSALVHNFNEFDGFRKAILSPHRKFVHTNPYTGKNGERFAINTQGHLRCIDRNRNRFENHTLIGTSKRIYNQMNNKNSHVSNGTATIGAVRRRIE